MSFAAKEKLESWCALTPLWHLKLPAIRSYRCYGYIIGLVFPRTSYLVAFYNALIRTKEDRRMAKILTLQEAVTTLIKDGSHIATIEKILNKTSGRVSITEFGIWGTTGNLKVPLGYNPWLEAEGRSGVGRPQEMEDNR